MLGRQLEAAVACGEWVCVLLCFLHLAKKKEFVKSKFYIKSLNSFVSDIFLPSALASERTDHTEPRRKE